jgi:AcrR family transcriptional regulator
MSGQPAIAAESRRRRRGRPNRYSREQIARAALDLVDADGMEALTMQRLAERLGAGTMTLYGYFRSRDELLDAIVDAAVEGVDLPRSTGTWREQLRETVLAVGRALTEHPAVVEIRVRRPILRPDALQFAERVIGLLREAGFDAEEAASGFRAIFTYTFGFAALSPERTSGDARHLATAVAASLEAERFPNLVETRREWTEAMAGAAQFDYGLDRLLDGLEARLAHRGRTATSA